MNHDPRWRTGGGGASVGETETGFEGAGVDGADRAEVVQRTPRATLRRSAQIATIDQYWFLTRTRVNQVMAAFP